MELDFLPSGSDPLAYTISALKSCRIRWFHMLWSDPNVSYPTALALGSSLLVFFLYPVMPGRPVGNGGGKGCLPAAQGCGQSLQHAQSELDVASFERMGIGVAVGPLYCLL